MDPAELLRTARWHAALSQAEVANRAGTSQQTLARYEKGDVIPTVAPLERVVAACGMRLSVGLAPEPGREDAPTRELLAAAHRDRLPGRYREPLLAVSTSLSGRSVRFLLAGKAAARLYGAVVRIHELDLWFPFKGWSSSVSIWPSTSTTSTSARPSCGSTSVSSASRTRTT